MPAQPEREGDAAVEDGWSIDLEKRAGREDIANSRLGVVTAADVDQLRGVIDFALFINGSVATS